MTGLIVALVLGGLGIVMVVTSMTMTAHHPQNVPLQRMTTPMFYVGGILALTALFVGAVSFVEKDRPAVNTFYLTQERQTWDASQPIWLAWGDNPRDLQFCFAPAWSADRSESAYAAIWVEKNDSADLVRYEGYTPPNTRAFWLKLKEPGNISALLAPRCTG